MGKNGEKPDQSAKEVKSFQERTEEIVTDPNLKERQPTPQPKEIDEIDY